MPPPKLKSGDSKPIDWPPALGTPNQNPRKIDMKLENKDQEGIQS